MDPTSDLRDGAGECIGGHPSPAAQEPPAVAAGPVAGEPMLESGQRWREYELGELIPGGPGRCFKAINARELEDVILRVVPIGDGTEGRRGAWALLEDLHQPCLVGLVEAHEEGAWRYEVSRVPPVMTLREWVACRQAASSDVETLVRQLSEALGALHGCGVVHLNLRPDTIHVVSAEGDLAIQLGGLELATLHDQPHPIPVPVDPYYAPPEAAGLISHPPGISLCSWDWWSLGRVVQEMVLGRHVLGHLLQRDVSKALVELRPQAEALLLEQGAFPHRAGAVEAMPAMNSTLESLLRGLLASARDGRWGLKEVQRWLGRQSVKDHYLHPRNERFFVWEGCAYAVPEAAEFFTRNPNWADGETNLFSADDPASLAHFIANEPAHRPLYERLTTLFDLSGMPEWRGFASTATRTALAAMAWTLLANRETALLIRGRRVNRENLLTLLRAEKDGPALIEALVARPYVEMVEKADPGAAKLFAEIAAVSTQAAKQAVENGWMPTDREARAQLLALALESPETLTKAHARLRDHFACTRDPKVETLFSAGTLERSAQVLLAYAERHPDRFGFVTHEEWNRERCLELRKRGEQIATALFWLRLRQALAANPTVFGSWRLFVAASAGAVAAAAFARQGAHGPGWVLWLLVTLLPALRLVVFGSLRRLVRRQVTGAKAWTLRDGEKRCRAELSATWREAVTPEPAEIGNQLAKLNSEIAALALKPAPDVVRAPGRFAGIWAGSIAGWLVLAMALGAAAHTGIQRLSAGRLAPTDAVVRDGIAAIPTDEVDADSAGPKADWSFGDPRSPRIAWDIPRPASMPAFPMDESAPATPDQVAFALVEGERQLQPYRRHTVKSLIAIRVPAATGVGLMLFDGRDGTVAERRVHLVKEPPRSRTWLEIAGHQVVFLDEPQ